ncbi:MAG: flagellar motor switch phosphatase FliY [Firmicutes bacterium]|nr:flagellar motor switch phosphatase FliY [Bacillota bacterium]
MKDNFLSQAEVDALLKKKEAADETGITEADVETLATMKEEPLKQEESARERVQVQKPVFASLEDTSEPNQKRNLDLILDVPLEFSVVLGKTKKTIKDVLALGAGSVVELNKLADEQLEVYVNGKLIAHGEVVIINENFGIRITQILSKEQRVKGLK